MTTRDLQSWLHWMETLHPAEIELGLDRIRQVYERMQLGSIANVLITVAGTNGKGSSVAILESIYHSAGYHVGSYTSPHLLRYNERICIDGNMVSDELLCRSFELVEQARGDVALTYFEFGTLSALQILSDQSLDVAVLEVGLGGRLDAVNLLDADAALITSIDIDHRNWLGDDRDTIAREKAGILRSGQVAVCADENAPGSLLETAAGIPVNLLQATRDFGGSSNDNTWDWWWQDPANPVYRQLPYPAIPGSAQLLNAAGVLAVIYGLDERLPVSRQAIEQGLLQVSLPGRFQLQEIANGVQRVLDVAHNPQSARTLARTLSEHAVAGRTLAVFAILADKDIVSVVAEMSRAVDAWYVAGLHDAGMRGSEAADIAETVASVTSSPVSTFDSVAEAYQAALADCQAGDRLLVFGSFHTVAQAMLESV
jgi:dihydrofolate synthase/folylpolyglutamate synthase